MSDLSTRRMLRQYEESAGAPTFLASHFRLEKEGIHNSDEVEIDVRRAGRPISVTVTDWKSGGTINTLDLYTNKSFKPPIVIEQFVANQGASTGREMGATPYEDPDYMLAVQKRLNRGVTAMIDKVRRYVELQAAQIFQTGALTLNDEQGNPVYTFDFGMKSEHKANASIDWDETTADPLADMAAADELVRKNGKKHIDRWILGDLAAAKLISNEKFLKLLDNRKAEIGGLAPQMQSEDQIYLGWVIVNGVKCELFTYKASYDLPSTGVDTKYVSDWNAIGMASTADRRATFGGIPRIVPVDPRISSLGIGAAQNIDKGIAFSTNAWPDPSGTTIFATVSTRPLLIPTAIDAHVCINTKVT